MSSETATTCNRPRPGPMYWDWRCLNCDKAIRLHPPLWRRLLTRPKNGSRQECDSCFGSGFRANVPVHAVCPDCDGTGGKNGRSEP